MLNILHAADFHLDSPFSGLTAAQAAQRRQELRQLPARLAQLVQTEQADLVLLPGDLFDGERVYPETVAALAQALGEMAVPVFIAPGNHDFYGPQSPYARVNWPGNVHIFTTPDLESVELPDLNCVPRAAGTPLSPPPLWPPVARDMPPWAIFTLLPAASRGTHSGPILAAQRDGALTNWERKAYCGSK